jgi:hypothetical protein
MTDVPVRMSNAEWWKYSTKIVAVIAALCYWGYLSYLHSLRDVCDNLKAAIGSNDGAYYADGEFGLSNEQMMEFVARSSRFQAAMRTCYFHVDPPYFGGDD